MKAIPHPGQKSYTCYGCDLTFLGEPNRVERLAETYYEDTQLKEVRTYTSYECHDPGGACSVREDDIEQYDEAFSCGECRTVFGNIQDAMNCCLS